MHFRFIGCGDAFGSGGRLNTCFQVGSDYKSSMIVVPLLERNPETNEPIDYAQLSDFLEDEVRSLQSDRYPIRIIGFAKLVGDLIDGIEVVSVFFAISALIATLILYLYTRDARSTALLVGAALLGVLWLLGMLKLCARQVERIKVHEWN